MFTSTLNSRGVSLLFFVLVVLICIYTLFPTYPLSFVSAHSSKENSQAITTSSSYQENNTSKLFNQCILKVYDPLFKKMKKKFYRKDPLIGCNHNYNPPTQLLDGKIGVHPLRVNDFVECSAGCLDYVSATSAKVVEWKNFTKLERIPMNCDIVTTRCFNATGAEEGYAHSQIVEKQSRAQQPAINQTLDLPNVFIILMDSVASPQARRSLPKTIQFLKRNMSGVLFHHLNKVGENSLPNGMALLMGSRVTEVDRTAIGLPILPAQVNWTLECDIYRDDDPIIFKEYEKAGYTTFAAEDYLEASLFTTDGCLGFKNQPTTHNFRPFTSALLKQEKVGKNVNLNNCVEVAREALNYTGMSIKSYPQQPKFGLTWLSGFAHNDANYLSHVDEYFEHEPLLRNSFVFFMGDHGPRFGATSSSILGKRERNNPFLMMVVPQRLRRKPLLSTLEENSMRLLTQFDVHATLVDILKIAPQSNFTNFNYTDIFTPNPNNATSILRPLGPFKYRNCRTIPVSFEYCENDMGIVSSPVLPNLFHVHVVKEMNKMITEHGVASKCAVLKLDGVPTVRAYAPEDELGLYELMFQTTPGNGEFMAIIHYNHNNGEIQLRGNWIRTNRYGKAGHCVKEMSFLKTFCFCLENFSKETSFSELLQNAVKKFFSRA